MEPTPERPAAQSRLRSQADDDGHGDGGELSYSYDKSSHDRNDYGASYTTVGAWPADPEDETALYADNGHRDHDQDQDQDKTPKQETEQTGRPSLSSPTVSDVDDDDAYETAPDEASDGAADGDSTGMSSQKNNEPCPPPFWTRHRREPSCASSITPVSTQSLIRLEDHTEDRLSGTSGGLWARSVSIDEHVVVKGKTGVGAYTVWICRIQMLEGGTVTVRMRYSEFVELRARLYQAFPYARHSLPELPPKSAFLKFNTKFLQKRREGLAYFLNCVLLNPEFSGAPVLKEFLFARI